ASETHLRLVADLASVYLAHLDREHRYKFVNRALAERFGLEQGDIIGKQVAEVVGLAAYNLFKPHIDEALTGRRVEVEIEVPYATLGARWVHAVYEPEKTPQGEVTGTVIVITDVTARKQVEKELELARDQALAAVKTKDDFLAALSHELRTPLNPILLLASERASDPALPAEMRADFDTILHNVSLEARLIDDLLDLTRIAHGKLTLDCEIIDVRSPLQEALAIVWPDVEEKSIKLVADLGDGACVNGDAVRLQQVFWNVLKNAVKFTPAEGKIEVKIEPVPESGEVRVQIADSGIGLTDGEHQRIFNAFAQGEHAEDNSAHKFGGLGLGLTISRALVEMHSGRIRAESAGRNLGTTLTIELPLAVSLPLPDEIILSDMDVSPPAGRNGDVAATASTGIRGRILIVEDHMPTLATLKGLLLRRRFEVLSACTLIEARSLIADQSFDLLISDIGLPDGSGYALMTDLQILRPGLPSIALSGYGMAEDVSRSRNAGFSEHLTKPISSAALDRAISNALGKRGSKNGNGERLPARSVTTT
ncbi:MAG: response regulator, partial [Verrucomicrobiota bacterium]|nr:response regulator [Verrucomicrobiota bacterium]